MCESRSLVTPCQVIQALHRDLLAGDFGAGRVYSIQPQHLQAAAAAAALQAKW